MVLARYTRKTVALSSNQNTKGLECYVDADHAGGWCQNRRKCLYSRTSSVIKYANCPVFWSSRLQTEIALSTAEAVQTVHSLCLTFHCKIWEDNQSTITMATTQKFTPRTKHIALKYHHFRKWVDSKDIEISYVRTEDQQADILTKPVRPDLFFPLRHMLMGW